MNANPNTVTHLCETCRHRFPLRDGGCNTCEEIDNGFFDEVLAGHKNEDKFDVVMTAIVVECKRYEKEE